MKFIEVLQDAVTVRGAVRRAGEVVQMPEEFETLSKRDQVKRWGKPRYRVISEDEYAERGGDTRGVPAELASAEQELASKQSAENASESADDESQGAQEPEAQTEASDDEFAAFLDVNVDDTLEAIAQFDEATLTRFIAWEKDNQNRKGVLEPLGASPE